MAGNEDESGKTGFIFQPLRLEDPDEIAGFRLVARLGSGGMGTVYLTHMRDGRPAALKVIRPELAEAPDFLHQFRREVAVVQRMSGRYLVPVLESDGRGPVPWLATAYVPGPSLGESTREHGPLPAPVVVRLIAGVAEALRDVHEADLVHRDLKPSNVLLTTDGPRVIDFGIARAVDATTIAASGRRLGTPGFMSPEQARGGQVGAPADVFALGLLAYFAVTGRGAFGRGEPDALLYRIVHDEPDLGDCPEGLRDLVSAALAKDPDERPSTGQILEACRVLFDGASPSPTEGWLPAPIAADSARRDAPAPRAPSRPGWMPGGMGAAPMGGAPAQIGDGAAMAQTPVADGLGTAGPAPVGETSPSSGGGADALDAGAAAESGAGSPGPGGGSGAEKRSGGLSWLTGARGLGEGDEDEDDEDDEPGPGSEDEDDRDENDRPAGVADTPVAGGFGNRGFPGRYAPYRGGFGPVIIHSAEPAEAGDEHTTAGRGGGSFPGWAGPPVQPGATSGPAGVPTAVGPAPSGAPGPAPAAPPVPPGPPAVAGPSSPPPVPPAPPGARTGSSTGAEPGVTLGKGPGAGADSDRTPPAGREPADDGPTPTASSGDGQDLEGLGSPGTGPGATERAGTGTVGTTTVRAGAADSPVAAESDSPVPSTEEVGDATGADRTPATTSASLSASDSGAVPATDSDPEAGAPSDPDRDADSGPDADGEEAEGHGSVSGSETKGSVPSAGPATALDLPAQSAADATAPSPEESEEDEEKGAALWAVPTVTAPALSPAAVTYADPGAYTPPGGLAAGPTTPGMGGPGPTTGSSTEEPDVELGLSDTPLVSAVEEERRRGSVRVAFVAAVAVVVVLGSAVGGGWALGLFGGAGEEHRDVTDLASHEPPPAVPDQIDPSLTDTDVDADEAEESLSPTEPDPDEEDEEGEKDKDDEEKDAESAEADGETERTEGSADAGAPAPAPSDQPANPQPTPDPQPTSDPPPKPSPTRSNPPAPPPPGKPGRDNCSHSTDRSRIWAEGMAGSSVRQIQCLLNHNYGRSLDTDGIFGPQSASAVRSVQRCSGIAVDGEVGPDTWRYLDTPKRSCGN